MAGYIPQESLAGFESLTSAGVLGGMSAGTALLGQCGGHRRRGGYFQQQRRRWRRRFFSAPGHHSAEGDQRPEDSA